MKLALTDDWFVGFVPAPNEGIWRLARGPFGHCMAFRFVPTDTSSEPAGVWWLVEANVWGLDAKQLAGYDAHNLIDYCLSSGKLLCVSRRRRRRRLLPPLMTCASVLAGLVALDGWWIVTPKQLYGALLRAGATPYKDRP